MGGVLSIDYAWRRKPQRQRRRATAMVGELEACPGSEGVADLGLTAPSLSLSRSTPPRCPCKARDCGNGGCEAGKHGCGGARPRPHGARHNRLGRGPASLSILSTGGAAAITALIFSSALRI
ncbi:hypothetical protein NL676_038444 [Syzygium grande]|nr:hypothetical protein NL676_038444 [Syzygium grande]